MAPHHNGEDDQRAGWPIEVWVTDFRRWWTENAERMWNLFESIIQSDFQIVQLCFYSVHVGLPCNKFGLNFRTQRAAESTIDHSLRRLCLLVVVKNSDFSSS